MAGSIFATFSLSFQISVTPTQKIRAEPTRDRLLRATSVRYGAINPDTSVVHPCKISTGIAEKIQPFPIDAVIIIIVIKSIRDFIRRTDILP